MFVDTIKEYFKIDPDYVVDYSRCKDYIKSPVTFEVARNYHRKMSGSFVKKINKIVKVYNPYLYSHFLIKKAEYESRGPVRIEELYHDTAKNNVDSILRTNLDWRRVCRGRFGRGVSFSPNPEYASTWSTRHNGCNRAMIVCDVLIGKSVEVRDLYNLSLPDCDTAIGNNSNVYVKFYDNEFYPTHVIYYEKRM